MNAIIERRIRCCIDDLNALVTGQGCSLTDPRVVQKSMELDELILLTMRKSSGRSA
ncbi:aspartyl-phosphate phosphatase Spo0E family protein [Paenibacillus sp. PvP091]|nr:MULTISPECIES: aspartyl-phosphate phosphatase Spo0E family protein [unclassified Paenibacillus]